MLANKPPYRIVLAGHGQLAYELLAALLAQPQQFDMVKVLPWSSIQPAFGGQPEDDAFIQLAAQQKRLFPNLHHYNQSFNTAAMHSTLTSLQPDVLLLATWGEILTAETLSALPFSVVNVHPSLLPDYRGANPYAAVILANEKQSGITLHQVDSGIDTGPMIAQWPAPVLSTDTGGALRTRLAALAALEIPDALAQWLGGALEARPQLPRNRLTTAPPLTLLNGELSLSAQAGHTSAEALARQVRALQPWIECFFTLPVGFYPFQNELLLTTRCIEVLDNVTPHPAGKPLSALRFRQPPTVEYLTPEGSLASIHINRCYSGAWAIPKVLWPLAWRHFFNALS